MALTPVRSGAASDALKNVRDTFEYGNYVEAVRLAADLLRANQISGREDLVEAYRISGLSNFYLNRSDAARRDFVSLLSQDPDFAMDPLLVPPAAVAFFDAVKRDNENLLGPIRQSRRAAAEQERLEEEARRRLLEDNLRRQLEPDRPVLVQRVEEHSRGLNFFPAGVGQFQESRPVVGSIFLGTETAAAGTIGVTYALIESLKNVNGKYYNGDFQNAQHLQLAENIAVGVLISSYAVGVIDSLLHYVPETYSIVPLPQSGTDGRAAPNPAGTTPGSTPAPPGPKAVPAPTPPSPNPPPPSPHAMLAPFATPGGAGVGLAVTF